MTRERINNLWGPADVAPDPEVMVHLLAKANFDAEVLIDVSGLHQRLAIGHLQRIADSFQRMVLDVNLSLMAIAECVLRKHVPDLTLMRRARIVFAFDEMGKRGRAPTHFYRGLP